MKPDNYESNLTEKYDWQGFYEEMQKESPRAVAIISGAFLDNLLRDLISLALIDDSKVVDELLGSDDKPDRPISSFGARIKLAYSLSLINEILYHDLDLIRKIRNKFAHKMHGYTFENQEIISWCNSLEFPKKMKPHHPPEAPYDLFVYTVSNFIGLIELKKRDMESHNKQN